MNTILSIDTSCDETSVAITQGLVVLSNIISSQVEDHKKYGGVLPSLAKIAHQAKIDNTIKIALERAKIKINEVSAISVTIGPGLAIALEVGINKAKELALKYNKPLLTINHMEGHLLSGFAQKNSKIKNIPENDIRLNFPNLGFLISGGHTELILIKNFGEYEKVGESVDDSCGEAYDKCGRMLGLGYPAGPIITKFAQEYRKNTKIFLERKNQSTNIRVFNIKSHKEYQLPVSMTNSNDLNFSFSGLKTAFKYLIEEITDNNKRALNKEEIMNLCVCFEAAALKQLTNKLEQAIKQYHPKQLWLGGGVIASARLRFFFREICKKNNILLRYPTSQKLTGDNAAMIGIAAYFILKRLNEQSHLPDMGYYMRDFNIIERNPSLSL